MRSDDIVDYTFRADTRSIRGALRRLREELDPYSTEFVLYLGHCLDGRKVWADVRLSFAANGGKPAGFPELSICFEATDGPRGRRGSKRNAWGQLTDVEFTPGTLGNRVREVWREHHLNDLHAGCEHQRALGWESMMEIGPHGYERLANVGVPCPVCGYRFGSAWQYVPIPEEIITEIRSWIREAIA